jgi:hypothetical protein
LKTELKNLYQDHTTNLERIIEIETILSKLNDDELRREVERIPGFEVLNSEKITPYFLSLAKGSQSEASMSDICDSNGQPFESLEDMKGFVKNFYSNIYKKSENEPESFRNCIENFLGPEICANPIVRDSKIPIETATRLEQPIGIHELDISVQQANKSASGRDGFSNCFIKKYWIYFRTPLHRYLTTVLRKGALTPTFRSGTLKLTQKGGYHQNY